MLREADDATLAEAAAAVSAVEATAAASGTAGTPPAAAAGSPSALAGPLTAATAADSASTNVTTAAAATVYAAAATSHRQYFITLYSGSAIKVRRSATIMRRMHIIIQSYVHLPWPSSRWRKFSMHFSCIYFIRPPSLQPLEEALADYRLNSAHDYPGEATTTRLVERGYSVGMESCWECACDGRVTNIASAR